MSKPTFRHPSQMPSDDERVPVSARVKVKTKKALEAAAKKHGHSFGTLVANVLDDYAEWLGEDGRKSK